MEDRIFESNLQVVRRLVSGRAHNALPLCLGGSNPSPASENFKKKFDF
jgi:hypothetical protein